jgi:uncharacterized membrane protein
MAGLDHPLVRTYLARLETFATELSPARRDELRTALEEHFAEFLPVGADDEAVSRVLARLGPPEDLVAEAGGLPSWPTTSSGPDDGVRLELATLVVFALSLVTTIGPLRVVAAILWLVGVILTLFSRRWTPGDKALAVLAYGVLGFPLLSGGVFRDGTSGKSWLGLTVVGLALLAVWVWACLHLYRRARGRTPERSHGIQMR